MSRFRMYPTPAQQAGLLQQCRHARYVWNLALEQWSMWTRDKGPTPGYVEQARQLTEARAAFGWLRAGSQTVQQQALRDFDQAVKNFYAGTHRRPTWRKTGRHEGFRIVGGQALRIVKLSRKWARLLVPKVGWVRFRLSRSIPEAKSYRVTRDRAGRWHLAFAVIPEPIPATKAGLNRGILANAWGALVNRLEHNATGRVERVNPAYTSQTCSVCGQCAPENRESQAVFRCVACGHRANADVNAAVNIAAGRAVSARRETPVRVSLKREPQLATST
jgi:transposase